MNNLESLVVLLAEAERERDLALAELGAVKSARAAANAQAEQLVSYRREYENRWSEQFCREGKIELVRCYQGFVERLTQAVDHQSSIAEQATAQVRVAEATLRDCEVRAAAVRKLVERRVQDAQAAAERRAQKQGDELASRAAWSRLAAARQASVS